MPAIPAKQRKQLVIHNIDITEKTVAEAEKVTQGNHFDTIFRLVTKLKTILGIKDELTLDHQDFFKMCKLRQQLAAYLYDNERGF